MSDYGVQPVGFDELLQRSGIVSRHAPAAAIMALQDGWIAGAAAGATMQGPATKEEGSR
ncbi:MAG TPA: hypothetical protein VHP37_17300 [Burkholderiales bacterium]|nr:hypothetical protein [Burkholderiales bacterium]